MDGFPLIKFKTKNTDNVLDASYFTLHYRKVMIEVTNLNGKKYWVNPHQIECMEENPDLTLSLLSGKKIVVQESPEEIINRIVLYRKKIGMQEL